MSDKPIEEAPQNKSIFDNAEDFFNAITSPVRCSPYSDEWVFRGHASHEWLLIPSVLRLNDSPNQSKLITQDYNDQLLKEIKPIISFLKHADKQGIKIAGDSMDIRERIAFLEAEVSCLEFGTTVYPFPLWIPKQLLPLVCLAQHYGIETRLLDWTSHPYTAAYFACKSNLFDKQNSKKDIVIWALNVKNLYLINHRPVEVIRPPAAENPNLAAQQGLFTLLRSEKLLPREGQKKECLPPNVNRWGLENIIGEYGYSDSLNFQEQNILMKFRLIKSEVPNLFKILLDSGVSAASLFPGFAGVAEATKEREKLTKLLINKKSKNKKTKPSPSKYINMTHNELILLVLEEKNLSDDKRMELLGQLVLLIEGVVESSVPKSELLDFILLIITKLKNNNYSQIYELLDIVGRVHRLYPTHPKVCFEMGRCYAHIADAEKAIQWYRRTLQIGLDGDDLWHCGLAYQCISTIFFDHLGNQEEYRLNAQKAVTCFINLLEISPESKYSIARHLIECCRRIQDVKTLKKYGLYNP
jgi:tetratricopeptide (TPR) repeat protein